MNALELIEAIAEQAGVTLVLDPTYDETGETKSTLREFNVLLAVQPSWPFQHNISRVIGPDKIQAELNQEAVCPEHPDYLIGHANCDVEFEEKEQPKVIYIAEAGQDGYLNSDAKAALGWGRGTRY